RGLGGVLGTWDHLHGRAHRDARSPAGGVPIVGVAAGGTGNVQVGPWPVADELLQEEAGGERTATAAAGVLDVGDLGVDVLAVIARQREGPDPFTRSASGGLHLLDPAVVVAHEA